MERLVVAIVAVAAGGGVAGLVGCGGDPDRFLLSGEVSYDGQPVAQGNIGFVPVDRDSSPTAGAAIVDGRYEIPRSEGPRRGTYRVVIFAERPSGKKIRAEESGSEPLDELLQYIPPQYNERSELSVEIDADRTDLNFALTKPTPQRGRR